MNVDECNSDSETNLNQQRVLSLPQPGLETQDLCPPPIRSLTEI